MLKHSILSYCCTVLNSNDNHCFHVMWSLITAAKQYQKAVECRWLQKQILALLNAPLSFEKHLYLPLNREKESKVLPSHS